MEQNYQFAEWRAQKTEFWLKIRCRWLNNTCVYMILILYCQSKVDTGPETASFAEASTSSNDNFAQRGHKRKRSLTDTCTSSNGFKDKKILNRDEIIQTIFSQVWGHIFAVDEKILFYLFHSSQLNQCTVSHNTQKPQFRLKTAK